MLQADAKIVGHMEHAAGLTVIWIRQRAQLEFDNLIGGKEGNFRH